MSLQHFPLNSLFAEMRWEPCTGMELRLVAAHCWCLLRTEEEGNKRQMSFLSSLCRMMGALGTS